MTNGDQDPSCPEVYETILSKLRDLRAISLVEDIEQAIGRGVLTTSPKEFSKNAGAVRPMTDEEKLTVALEFVIAACQPPILVESAREALNCNEIVWEQDERARDQAEIRVETIGPDEAATLQRKLSNLTRIMDQLSLKMPEVM